MTFRGWRRTECREGSAGDAIRLRSAYIPTKNVGTYAPPALILRHAWLRTSAKKYVRDNEVVPIWYSFGCYLGGRLARRTRPGSTTVKASESREPSLATASTTDVGLARRTRLGNLTRITPAEACPRAYTNSPKSGSSVMRMRRSPKARLITSSSTVPLANSAIATT